MNAITYFGFITFFIWTFLLSLSSLKYHAKKKSLTLQEIKLFLAKSPYPWKILRNSTEDNGLDKLIQPSASLKIASRERFGWFIFVILAQLAAFNNLIRSENQVDFIFYLIFSISYILFTIYAFRFGRNLN